MDPDAKVSSLIDHATYWWDFQLIRASFTNSEVEAICSMVLSPLGQPDKLICLGNSIWCFPVKSAYHMEMTRRSQDRRECSSSKDNFEVWRAIWVLQTPGVLKNFVWKLFSNALATKENLYWRYIVSDPLFPLYLVSNENVWHMVWSCLLLLLFGRSAHVGYISFLSWRVMELVGSNDWGRGWRMMSLQRL